MTQTNKDDSGRLDGDGRLGRSVGDLAGADAAPWLATQALSPTLRGLRVVDAGSGDGRWCRSRPWTASIDGIDGGRRAWR